MKGGDIMEPILSKSYIEGSDLRYIAMQGYLRHDQETLHLQGKGPEINRTYGISHDIPFNEVFASLRKWMDTIPKGYHSLANTEKMYFLLQMRYAKSTNALNFQINYTPIYNTPYGGNFSVGVDNHPELMQFWNAVENPEPKEEQPLMVQEVEE